MFLGLFCRVVSRDVHICLGNVIVRYINVISLRMCELFLEVQYLIMYFVVACFIQLMCRACVHSFAQVIHYVVSHRH